MDTVDTDDVRIIMANYILISTDWFINTRACGVYIVTLLLFMKETRSSILLTRIAKNLRKKTGDQRYRARVEDERASLKTLIWISCTRPVRKFPLMSTNV